MFLNLLLISLAASFSVFLGQAYQNSQIYHNKAQNLSNFDTMSLAASSRVSKETNHFLLNLQNYLNESIKAKSQGQKINQEELKNIFNNYLKNINPNEINQLNETIKFVINQSTDSKDLTYEAKLLNSTYLPTKLTSNHPGYISTLITQKQVKNYIDIYELKDFYKGTNLLVSLDLISALVSPANLSLISSNPAQFGLEISSEGLSLNNLPNGVSLEIFANNQN